MTPSSSPASPASADAAPSRRKPEWLKVRAPAGETYRDVKHLLKGLTLHTVCEEARCPNVGECWGGGTATVMIMGDVCTRGCRFCAVRSGHPGGVLDPREPENVAEALDRLKLHYVVLTSVDRDDLPDGGADHFARTVEAIKQRTPEMMVEVLIPDFDGRRDCLERVVASGADVVAHNLETVRRLTPRVRDRRATYDQSLGVLRTLKDIAPSLYTKSSLMVGIGESDEEIDQAMDDLRGVDVDVLTLGQYLRPSDKHLDVQDYIRPERFADYRRRGEEKGFLYVASGPLVRSSYRAGEFFLQGLLRKRRAGTGGNQ